MNQAPSAEDFSVEVAAEQAGFAFRDGRQKSRLVAMNMTLTPSAIRAETAQETPLPLDLDLTLPSEMVLEIDSPSQDTASVCGLFEQRGGRSGDPESADGRGAAKEATRVSCVSWVNVRPGSVAILCERAPRMGPGARGRGAGTRCRDAPRGRAGRPAGLT